MTATFRPIRCPHGTALVADHIVAVYEDGCRTTSGIPARFWCGANGMNKPDGVSIFEGEYLRDWADAIHENFRHAKAAMDAHYLERDHAEALILNEGDELYDRAVMLNEISDGLDRIATKHEPTLGQDPIAVSEYYDSTLERNLDICGWCGGLAVLDPRTAACVSCVPNAEDHAARLGEVPWSDRVED